MVTRGFAYLDTDTFSMIVMKSKSSLPPLGMYLCMNMYGNFLTFELCHNSLNSAKVIHGKFSCCIYTGLNVNILLESEINGH